MQLDNLLMKVMTDASVTMGDTMTLLGSLYLPPLPGLWMVLPILGLPQQVREHQRFEGTGARGSRIAERVHHA